MTSDVFVSISGTHMSEVDNQDVELIVAGKYEKDEHGHKVVYEEQYEGVKEPVKNTLHINSHGMDIVKEGVTNARMSFIDNGKKELSYYNTPFGEIVLGIKTQEYILDEHDDRLLVSVKYALESGDDFISDCNIKVNICSKHIANESVKLFQ